MARPGLLSLALSLLLTVTFPPGVSGGGLYGELTQEEYIPEYTLPPTPEVTPEITQSSLPDDATPLQPSAEPSAMPQIPNSRAGATALTSHEAVVTTYAELKAALGGNNGITTVYLGDNIAMQASGVSVHSSKASVIVDGMNPLDETQTTPHTLTDYASALISDTVYVNNGGVSSLLIRNMVIVGKNYYGPFSVVESSATDNLVVTYQNVKYNGPQMGHHRRGRMHFIDCSIKIHGSNGGSPVNELAEVKHLVFEGMNTVEVVANTLSIFWLPVGGTFELSPGASLDVEALNMPTSYGVFYADAAKISVFVGAQATFRLTISGTLAPLSQAVLSGMSVGDSGAFSLRTTKAAAANVMTVSGNLTVGKNALFEINGFGGASYALLEQRTGDISVGKDAVFHVTCTSPYGRLIDLFGRSVSFEDPASVLLYNAGGRLLQASSSAAGLCVNAQQINVWHDAAADSFERPPLYAYAKANGSNYSFEGSIAIGASGNYTNISSNYAEGDSPAPDAARFNAISMRILSCGRLNLSVNTVTTQSTAITGVCVPNATVRASFTQEDTDYLPDQVTAESDGLYRITAGIPLKEATVIYVDCMFCYLRDTAVQTVNRIGSLEFTVPTVMQFHVQTIFSTASTAMRINPDWDIIVSDTRGPGQEWMLLARLAQPLTPTGEIGVVLPNALVYIAQDGGVAELRQDETLLIQRRTAASGEDLTRLSWTQDKGVLIRTLPGEARATTYTAAIEWIMSDGP